MNKKRTFDFCKSRVLFCLNLFVMKNIFLLFSFLLDFDSLYQTKRAVDSPAALFV